MSTSTVTFFSAWEITDADERARLISNAVADGGTYADPMTPAPIVGPSDIADYVANFSANAPGWGAWVLDEQTQHGTTRATVAFGEGSTPSQYGQYFVEVDDDGMITKMVGFVGLYTPG